MSEIKFGIKQFKNPMPAVTTRNLGIAAFIFSTLNTWLMTAQFIPAILSSVLQGLSGLGSMICLGLIPFFGVQTTQKRVDIKDVASIETGKTE